MFDHVDPWASEVDIDAGSRGLEEIKDRLNESAFGIVVVTTENYERPWLNFEAGSLSKRLDGNLERVIPLLVNFEDVNQLVSSPLHQFQRVILDKEGIRNICKAIAKTIKLDVLVIDERFEMLWPDLEKRIDAAKSLVTNQPPPPQPEIEDLLKQLLAQVDDLKRAQHDEIKSAKARLNNSSRRFTAEYNGKLYRDPAAKFNDLEQIREIIATHYPDFQAEVSSTAAANPDDGYDYKVRLMGGPSISSQSIADMAKAFRRQNLQVDITLD